MCNVRGGERAIKLVLSRDTLPPTKGEAGKAFFSRSFHLALITPFTHLRSHTHYNHHHFPSPPKNVDR